jgi:membrane protease YdiL (CAAX protease family)
VQLFHWSNGQRIINAGAGLIAIPIWIGWTYFFRRKVDQRPWAGIRLTAWRQGLPQLALGFLLGTVLVGVIFGLQYAFGWIQIVGIGVDPKSGGLGVMLGFLLLVLATTSGGGFVEEIGYRGYVFQNLGVRFPLWVSLPLSGILFSVLVHYNKLTLSFAVQAALIGMLFALCRLSTRALWLAIGLHWAFDWSLSALYGLSDQPPYGYPLLHLTYSWPGHGWVNWLYVVVILVALLLFLAWMRVRGQPIDWRARLNEEGQVIEPREAGMQAQARQALVVHIKVRKNLSTT